MEVTQNNTGIKLNQNQYISQKLKEFDHCLETNIKRSVPLDPKFQTLLIEAEESTEIERHFPYRSIVGSILFAAIETRPDIACAAGIVSRFLDNPKKIHCDMVRQILYYLRQNPSRELLFKKSNEPKLELFCDASYANNEDYTSISGFAVLYGNSLVSWSSRKQADHALSSTEAEYIAAADASQEALSFRSMLEEIGFYQETTIIHEDNESCIKLSKNPQDTKRTRHIQVKYHFIRNLVKQGIIKLIHCKTQNQLADIFTKGVNGPRLKSITRQLGIEENNHYGRELSFSVYPIGHINWKHSRDKLKSMSMTREA